MSLIILFIVFACTSSSHSDSVSTNHPPVILVPGLVSSQLEVKWPSPSSINNVCEVLQSITAYFWPDGYWTMWFNPLLWIPGLDRCSMYLFKLDYNNVTRKTTNMPGTEIRVKGFGDPYWVEYLVYDWRISIWIGGLNYYFKGIADALYSIGYTRNVSLRAAPYDFRKGPSESQEYFNNLKKLVMETYKTNGNRKVLFVTHSLGGSMVNLFLKSQSKKWKDKYIKAMIAISNPITGAVKPLQVYAADYTFNQPELFYLTNEIKEISESFPSIAYLMPNKEDWKDQFLVYRTDVNKNYSMSNIRDFFKDIDGLTSWEMLKDQEPYISLDPPGVELHCIYGTTETPVTTEALVFDDSLNNPYVLYGEGDKIVNLRSLNYCTKWTNRQKQKVFVKSLTDLNHVEILNDQQTIDYVVQAVEGYSREGEGALG